MKKSIIYAFLIMSSFAIISCQKEIRTTAELEQIFSEEEIKDINTIVTYYEERLKKQTNSNQIDSAFHKFAQQNVMKLTPDLSGFDKESLKLLYYDINAKTHDQIWDKSPGYSYEIKDSIQDYTIAYEKKFMNYLDLVGEANPKIEFLVDRIKTIGTVQGYFVNTLYQDFDDDGTNPRLSKKIGDFNNSFITAVITITIAENIHTDEMIATRKAKMQQSN